MNLRGTLKRRYERAKKIRETRRARSQAEKDIYHEAYESERLKGLAKAGTMKARAELKAGELHPQRSRIAGGLRKLGRAAERASFEAERGRGSRERTRYFDAPSTHRARSVPFGEDWAAQELRGSSRAPTRTRRKKGRSKRR